VSDVTWEDVVEFQGWYPLFELEDELFSKEERDVMVD
jgi:hypothetical protein